MGSVAWSKTEHRPAYEQRTKEECSENIHQRQPLLENTRMNEEEETKNERESYPTEINQFKDYLEQKRQQRQKILSRHSEELKELRESKDDLEKERIIRIGLEKQVNALKEVCDVSNEMLKLREAQVAELKKRLHSMESATEESLATLRNQYEIQIENIRRLRQLYDERAEASARGYETELEKEKAKNMLLELKLVEYTGDAAVNDEKLVERIKQLETQADESRVESERLKTERSSFEAQCRNLNAQLSIINNLFSNALTGDMNFDLLTQLLQDNHNLICDLTANGDINDTAAILVNIAQQTFRSPEGDDEEEEAGVESGAAPPSTTAYRTKEAIASTLPKVWRVLIELLSSHENSTPVPGTSDECYKRVNTANGGSRTVISVSRTFLRLKDLIVEKHSLVKEVGRLKTLNGHLENRLELQEKRLAVVSSELRKTWGVVSKLKVQHRQLHTNEKVLRYELQHKRQMLNELKNELEYCKQTWDKAREKNTQTEHDWELLRKEFALRKCIDTSNSAESGYEDDESSQDISAGELEEAEVEEEVVVGDDDDDEVLPRSADFEFPDAASDASVVELMNMLDYDETSAYVATADTVDGRCVQEMDRVSVSRECGPSSTTSSSADGGGGGRRSLEEILDARAGRLKRLEQQCRSVLHKMTLNSLRGDTLATRLEELHEQYGCSEESRRSSTRPSVERDPLHSTAASEAAESANKTFRDEGSDDKMVDPVEGSSEMSENEIIRNN